MRLHVVSLHQGERQEEAERGRQEVHGRPEVVPGADQTRHGRTVLDEHARDFAVVHDDAVLLQFQVWNSELPTF